MAEIDELVSKYLGYVDRGAALIPTGRAPVWKEFFFNPAAAVRKDSIGIGERLKDLYVASAIELAIGIISILPVLALMVVLTMGIGLRWVGLAAVIMLVGYVLGPVLSFLYSILEYVVAKALGGAGTISENFNASVLPRLGVFVITLPLLIVNIPVTWLSFIPLVNICMLVVRLPLVLAIAIAGLYGLYLKYLAMKEVHKLSSGRAAAVVIVPIVALLVVAFVIMLIIYITMFAAMFGMLSAMGAAGGLRPGS